MPARSQGARLSLSVSDHCESDQIWVIKYRTKSVRDGVTKLSTFV